MSILRASAGLQFQFRNKTLTNTSGNSDGAQIIFASTSSSILTVTLLTADTIAGAMVIIKDVGGNAGTNNITIDTEGSELIDGAATATISTNDEDLTLVCDGSDWYSIT